MKTIIQHTRGNRIELLIPLSMLKFTLTDGDMSREDHELLLQQPNTVVRLYRGGIACYEFTPTPKGIYLSVVDRGTILSGKYSLEVKGTDRLGMPLRFKDKAFLEVNEYTDEGGVYDSNEYNVIAYQPYINGRASAIVIEEGRIYLEVGGHFGEDDDPNDRKAMITTGYGEGHIEREEGKIILYM